MGSQSLTIFDAALKDDYSPGLRNAVNDGNVLLPEIQRNDKDIVGRQAVWSVHTKRSTSTGARAELAALPPAGAQGYDPPKQKLRFVYHTIKVSGPATELTQNERGAFRRVMEAEMDGAERDLKNDVARELYNSQTNSNDGVIVNCGTTTASLTVQLQTTTLRADMRMFFAGMYVDITDNAGNLISQGKARKITSISRTNSTITIDTNAVPDVSGAGSGVVTTSSSHFVTRAGSFGSEMVGMRTMIDDGTTFASVHGLSNATSPAWASVKVGSSTTPISEDLLEQLWDAIGTDGAGDNDEDMLFVTAFEQRRTLANKLQAQKRYDGREITLRAGWRGLQISHGIMGTDKYAPEDRVMAVNRQEMCWFVGRDFGVDVVGGQSLFQALDGTDAWEARIKAYVTLAVTNRNSHGLALVQTV
jgi:hypothetical protein